MPRCREAEARAVERAAAGVGIAASVLFHAFILWMPVGPGEGAHSRGGTTDVGARTSPPPGIRVVRLSGDTPALAEPRTPDPVPPARAPETEPQRSPAPSVDPARADGVAEQPGGVTRTEPALAPSLGVARLWDRRLGVDAAPDLRGRERNLIAPLIAAYYDRRAEEQREVAGMDSWTREDETGDTWGLSPGRFHFGSATVPTCYGTGMAAADCGFGLLPTRRDEFNDRMFAANEILRQASRFSVERSWSERNAAVRARRDAARRDSIRRDRR